MRTAYAIVGLALMAIVGAALFFINRAEVQKTRAPATVLESNNPSIAMMTLRSTAFEANGLIPLKFSCDADNINPELLIEDVPHGAASLVLLVDDPDIPEVAKEKLGVQVFEHWNLFNIPATTRVIGEGSTPTGAIVGKNSSGEQEYRGPCPPDGEHRYFFKLFALDRMLELKEDTSASAIRAAMQGHILGEAELVGRYARTFSQ